MSNDQASHGLGSHRPEKQGPETQAPETQGPETREPDCHGGHMQYWPLRVCAMLDHAAQEHGSREIVTHWADGRETRSCWAEVALDSRRLAHALTQLGLSKGDRVATLAMNHGRHLVAWFGTIGMGGIIHTVNPRLFEDQIVFILNHAADRVLFFDKAFAPLVARIRPRLTTITHFFLFDPETCASTQAEGEAPDAPGYPALIESGSPDFAWVEGEEVEPCMLCYTSGTTGNPKGVIYEHRSTTLHALTEIQPDVFDLSCRSVVLPIVPMFHAAAWGLPFAGAMVGAKFVFSTVNDAGVLAGLMRRERVTHGAGVPTVWLSMFNHFDTGGEMPEHLKIVTSGGSAMPRAMIQRMTDMGISVRHVWGMTEISPLGTMGTPRHDWDELDTHGRLEHMAKQGRVPFGIQMRSVDDAGQALARDGETSGRLQVRGPWVIRRYFRAEADITDGGGWFDTGDVAKIHGNGMMEITDRAKDVIKSGGEWISSVELENAAIGCPGVAEAAAIGVAHPRWDERPLLLVVRKVGVEVDAAAVRAHLAQRVAKWWLPDAIEFVDELPHSATGKLLKTELRARFGDYRWPEGA